MNASDLKPKSSTIARTIALAVALISQVVVMYGGEALPFSQDEVYKGASIVLTVIASLWAWWKNNSITQHALVADEFMDELKAAEQNKE